MSPDRTRLIEEVSKAKDACDAIISAGWNQPHQGLDQRHAQLLEDALRSLALALVDDGMAPGDVTMLVEDDSPNGVTTTSPERVSEGFARRTTVNEFSHLRSSLPPAVIVAGLAENQLAGRRRTFASCEQRRRTRRSRQRG